MQTPLLSKTLKVLLLLFLVVAGLYFSKKFTIPIALAGILSMLFLPLSVKMEKKGVSRGLSALFCVLILLVFFAGLGVLLSWQISDLAKDASQLNQKVSQAAEQLKQFMAGSLGISEQKQQEILQKQQASGAGGVGTFISTFMKSLTSVLVDTLLVLVYIFLFLYFRSHIKKFVLRIVPDNQKPKTGKVMKEAVMVAQQYLVGLFAMIVLLWVMYGIGFSIVGVKNALFFAVLCGTLEIIPFIGNLTGTAITVLFTLVQGGGTNMIVGVVVTYAVVQFLQSYLVEPLVVGSEVNVNPLFTIVALVLGELIWGIPGMIIAVPLLGIIKIVCDHVEPLKPYGFLIGKEGGRKSGIAEKVKSWFK